MTWPTDGTDGWEDFGAPITTGPESHPLPVVHRARYYEPTPLGGVGTVLEQGVHTFGASTVVARGRISALEVEFLQPEVYGVHLLDWLTWDPSEPCAVVLDVYQDDRTTLWWSVGTAPSHARPYLVMPEQYATQEVDVATGAATLGTVTAVIADVHRTPGDQDSGWVTRLLGKHGYGNLAGRRGRLRRFISEAEGWVVLADGPLGTPAMEPDYSAFRFPIRDTRETERKVQIFKGGGGTLPTAPGEPFDPQGVKTLLPDAVWGGYGYDPDSATYLVDPAAPLLGRVSAPPLAGFTGGPDIFTTRVVDLTATPGNAIALRKLGLAVARAGEGIVEPVGEPFVSGAITYQDYVTRFPSLSLYWRLQGDPDWNVIDGADLQISGRSQATPTLDFAVTTLFTGQQAWPSSGAETHREITEISFGHRLYVPIAAEQYLPAINADIELIVVYRGPPSEDLPVYLEGLTAGEFTRNVYRGLYSPRDADGLLVPTGILHDEDALLQMTELVRFRLTAVVDDARDWLEKHIYAPLGWAPALDHLGQISPVSQVPPLSPLGLLAITDDVAAPSPDWDAGERIVSVLKFVYQREYRPANPDHAETGDGLATREIVLEFEEPLAVQRFGRVELTIQGDAFRAIGNEEGQPVGGAIARELGYQLALLREQHVRNRFAFGAPGIAVPVRRAATAILRAGSWVAVDLSWLPDYVTRRRGLIGLGQVVALGDLDCAWRQALIEMVVPPLLPDSGS